EAMHALTRRFAPRATRVEVVVPADRLLVKEMRLPLAAQENLTEVLGFEMPRHTPFRADQVYFNYRVTARDPAAQMLAVRVALAPRSSVQPLLGLLDDWGLEQAAARALDDGEEDVLEFVPQDFQRSAASGLNRALIVINAVLLAAVVAMPLLEQQRLLDDLRVRLDSARDAAKAAVALEERLAAERERIAFLQRAKAAHPAVVELIESLSRRLPDDTWLYRLELREDRIEFQGTSGAASALIAALEESGAFEDVRFGSPVTQDAGDGRERFHVSARIVPRADAARGTSG
ncbi:MAG: PilN domain-containing protein, partial [Gammaproteobacteria bacterium]|nr:PilN domain-containing protein [Gammaproteobacteria bacterium]